MLNARPRTARDEPPPALLSLHRQLAGSLKSMAVARLRLGDPEALEAAARQASELFKGVARATLVHTDPQACALAYVRGLRPTGEHLHLLAGVLTRPLDAVEGRRLIGHPRLAPLLSRYAEAVAAGELSLLTWFGLLCSYFEFDPLKADGDDRRGWERLRGLLADTWPAIDRQAGPGPVPDWLAALRDNTALLRRDATDAYALDWLRGDDAALARLSRDLAVPESSWFWHLLVRSAARKAAELPDDAFKPLIEPLLALLDKRPVFRDEGLAIVLTRYHQCASAPLHRALYAFLVRDDVWRHPELKTSGQAPAWHRVAEPVWQRVMCWVNGGNLQDFFGVVVARKDADEGRRAFWSRYRDQISWTRFVFCPQTLSIARRHAGIRELVERENGAYTAFWSAQHVDALMFQIGRYLIVEFSTTGNPAYVYDATRLSFDRHALKYLGGTEALRYGFRDAAVTRIERGAGWEAKADARLRALGVEPDPA
ncbi:MAG: EH signature domain-containing protein [Burkholderiaceae bacterium]